MLLEKAIPGITLKSSDTSFEDKIKVYSNICHKLKSNKLSKNHNFKNVKEILNDIDKIDNRISPNLVSFAKKLRNIVLSSMQNTYLCHGDLHLENIISNNNEWLSIDPKGIIGNLEYEASAFDLIEKEKIDKNDILNLIMFRCQLLSSIIGLNNTILLKWIYLRCLLSAWWFIEDKGDPSFMIKMTENLYRIINNKN